MAHMTKEDINDETKGKNYFSTLARKFRSDVDYRERYLTSVSICCSFVVVGWQLSQMGPSFLDLQFITHVTLEKGSVFVTAYWIGYLSGSFFNGLLIDRCNKLALICSNVILALAMFIAIPWCSIFELMATAQFLRGLGSGGWDSGGTALIVFLWGSGGSDGRSFLQVLNFAYAFGGILSPLVTAPFLIEEAEIQAYYISQNATKYKSLDDNSKNLISNHNVYINESSSTTYNTSFASLLKAPAEPTSRLYIAYLITAGLMLLSVIPMIWFLIKSSHKTKTKEKGGAKHRDRDSRRLPVRLKFFIMTLVASYFFFNCGAEDTFVSFLATFCVEYMNWTKADASYVTFVYWLTFATGRFLGIFSVRFFSLLHLLTAFSACLCTSCIGFVLSGYFQFDTGIWISSAFLGFGISLLFPTMISWIEDTLLPVTGKIASLLFFTASVGAMLNPIILGYLMETFSPLWFPVLITAEHIFSFSIFMSAFFLSKYLNRVYGKMERSEIEITVEDQGDETQEELIDAKH